MTEHSDYILRGVGRPVHDAELLEHVAAAFPGKYPWWHPQVRDGQFISPNDDQPRTVFQVTPTVVFAFGREEGLSASRWDFDEETARVDRDSNAVAEPADSLEMC